MPTPLYDSDVQKIVDRTPKTALIDTDVFVVADEDGTLAPITKPNAKATLDIDKAETDISLLQAQVLENYGDISTLEGEMDTAQDDIDSLEGRMTLAEQDIDALEAEVETILVGQDLDPNKDVEVLGARASGTTADSYATIGDRMDTMETRTPYFDSVGAYAGYIQLKAVDGHLVLSTTEV